MMKNGPGDRFMSAILIVLLKSQAYNTHGTSLFKIGQSIKTTEGHNKIDKQTYPHIHYPPSRSVE